MPRIAELLEREGATVDLEGDHFERMLRRRDRKRRNQRIGAGALAIIIALVSFVALTSAFRTAPLPADEPTPPTFTGMVITYTGDDPRSPGDLVAQDPDTGEVRTLVDGHSLRSEFSGRDIGSAALSADGRWAAFEVLACGGGVVAGPDRDGTGGLWVTNGLDEPRQLTSPCFEDPDDHHYYNELWEWSPTNAQLVVARISVDGTALVLIDAATGERTDLGEAAGPVTTLTWSPGGNRITYGATGGGGSVYSVGVGGGEHSLLASSLGTISNQGVVFGWGIRWSPDGAHFVVQTYGIRGPMNKLLLMNADGSDLRPLSKDLDVETAYWSPGLSWSPDGTRMAYASSSGGREERQMQIWTGSSDGSAPSLLFESAFGTPIETVGNPVWSPDGAQIAFEATTSDGGATWLVTNADGTGGVREIDELRYLSWRGGWYFCQCYG